MEEFRGQNDRPIHKDEAAFTEGDSGRFPANPLRMRKKVRIGHLVGEIYVKYSPLGNNNLEAFLLSGEPKWWFPAF